mgnify:CR=1 FL=1
MNKIFKNSLKGGVLALVAMLGLTACTDDHFDVNGGKGDKTIWQNIESNPQLSQLKQILSRSYMMRSETDKINPSTTKTLAQLLDETQSFTVWAPLDGKYDAEHYLNLLDQAEAAYDSAGVCSEFLKMEYAVANQFVYNHVARFNYESNPAEQEVILLNGKKVKYTAGGDNPEFNGVAIQGSPIVASNGTMHLIGTNSPFAYNIYDYIVASDQLKKLSEYLFDPSIDKYTFSEGSSVQGALNENGDMVYVDSVWNHTNDILNECNAKLQNEDSLYVAILPTDGAWDAAVENLSKYFKYQSTYYYDWSNANSAFANNKAATAYKLNVDSLTNYNVKASMIRSAFFSPSTWHGISAAKDSAEVVDYALTADSLISTNHTIYYNSNMGGINPMFNGQKPEHASNGYVFCVDEYAVQPEYTWMKKEEIDPTSQYNMAMQAMANSHCTEKNGSTILLTSLNRDSIVADPFEVTKYQRFQRADRNTLQVDYRLSNLMSASYTIKAVLAPSRICYDIVPNDTVTEISTFYVQVLDDKGNAIEIAEGNNGTSAKNKTRSVDFTVDQDAVTEYVVIPRIDIPYSYYGLPSDCNTFCRLRFNSEYDRKKSTEGDGLNIVRIVIEPYRETAE